MNVGHAIHTWAAGCGALASFLPTGLVVVIAG
jgi:hypothetical protein